MNQKDTQLAGFTDIVGGSNAPVSGAQIGSIVGLAFGPLGALVFGLIGGLVDMAIGAIEKGEARKKLKKSFFDYLLKRYNTQIFISALERMGPAMLYVQSLGIKPGTPQFEDLLKRKLYSEIGYRGNCEIDLYGPAPPGQKRPLLATISRTGKMTTNTQYLDPALGAKWVEACEEMHKAALQAWAEEQKEKILFEREMKAESEEAKRNAITRMSINAGIVLLFIGYMLRQKKKIK